MPSPEDVMDLASEIAQFRTRCNSASPPQLQNLLLQELVVELKRARHTMQQMAVSIEGIENKIMG